MRHDFLDRFSRNESPIHCLPASIKLVVAVLTVAAVVLTPPSVWVLFVAVGILLVSIVVVSRIPPRFVVLRLLILEPLAVGGAALSVFQPNGWSVFFTIVLKSTLCLLTMILLSSTTPFDELLAALRRARMPALLITTLALMYRYLFVLLDESRRMGRARQSRTFHRPAARSWRTPAGVAARLFVRASERAERIYAAMCARGWK